jgi:hypothetical protein
MNHKTTFLQIGCTFLTFSLLAAVAVGLFLWVKDDPLKTILVNLVCTGSVAAGILLEVDALRPKKGQRKHERNRRRNRS